MKKYLVGIIGILALIIVPILTSATVADIDPTGQTSSCVSLQNNLRYKTRDALVNGEVSTLQDFLQEQGFLNSEPTGYFGLLTLKALKNFQSENEILPTGYVGPMTRAKISTLSKCGSGTSSPVVSNPTPVPVIPNPVIPNPVIPNPVIPNPVIPNPVIPNLVIPNHPPSISYPTSGLKLSSNDKLYIAIDNPVFGTTYTVKLLYGGVALVELGRININDRTDRFKTFFILPNLNYSGGSYSVGLYPFVSGDNLISPSFIINSSNTTSSPVINYVQSPAEDQNILHSGERATIYGSNLPTNPNVMIGSYSVSGKTNSYNSQIDFVVPSISAGSYLLSIPGSNSINISVPPAVNTEPVAPLSVTFPSASSSLQIGHTYNITWVGSDAGVRDYAVYLVSGPLGDTASIFLGTAYASTHTFSWIVPTSLQLGSGYQIQLSGRGATGDNSPSFAITAN